MNLEKYEEFHVLDTFPSPGAPLHLIPAAFHIDFLLPANKQTLEYGRYSHKCIERMIPLEGIIKVVCFWTSGCRALDSYL